MEIDLKLLAIQNPWWSGQSLKYDPVIDIYSNQFLQWRPEIIDELILNKDLIYTIQGARGVGKTTILKLLIKELIEKKKVEPKNIFYYSCHNLNSYEQLNELIKIFISWRRRQCQAKKRLFIFIDEATLVKNWEQGINYLKGAGLFKGVTLILSGSVLPLFKKKTGRIDKIINSLSLVDFIKLINPQLLDKVGRAGENYQKYKNQLEYYLDAYLLTGGFMAAINDFKEYGAVKQIVYSNYLYWLMADMAKLGRDMVLLRQILENILFNLGQAIGYKTLAHKTKAKTHLTVAEYINILESMFAIKVVYQSDKEGRIAKSRAKKIYFHDPFIFWVFYSYIYGSLNYWQFSRERLHEDEVFANLVDNVVLSHLIKEGAINNQAKQITYWRDNIRQREINFLVHQNKRLTPILIRYQQEVTPEDKKIFTQAGFNKGVIINKDKLNLKGQIKIIPLVYFLLFYQEIL